MNSVIKFSFSIIQIPGADLSEESLPATYLKAQKTKLDPVKISGFEKSIHRFSEIGDSIISEVCRELEHQHEVKTNIVLCNGIPNPYDAWTAKLNGKTAIFFNLDLWNHEEIESSAIPIIKHEIVHFILEPFLPPESDLSFSERLERIVIDEGIAHFIGFTQNSENLLEIWPGKWEQAELELKKAFKVLKDVKINTSVKNQLLVQANTGSFWDKFGAIAGMFRAAKVYKETGSKGLVSAIRKKYLSTTGQNHFKINSELALPKHNKFRRLKSCHFS